MTRFQINRKLWPMKAHYFLWNAGTAPVVPFLTVYAKQLGFSSFIVGIIYTVLPICGLIVRPTIGAVADKYNCQKRIFLVNILLTAVMFVAILYIPETRQVHRAHFACDFNEAVFDTCLHNVSQDLHSLKLFDGEKTLLNGLTSTCELNCPLNDKMWYSVKSYWNYTQQSSYNLQFRVHTPIDLMDKFTDECVIFRVTNVTLDGQTFVPSCPSMNAISALCDIDCDINYLNRILPEVIVDDDTAINSYNFWLFVMFMVLAWIGQALVVSVSDTICFQLLDDQPNKYGNQRCFGSLGWGIFAVIAGLIVDASSSNKGQSNYTYAFYLGFAMLLLDFIISFNLKIDHKKSSMNIMRDISKLLGDIRVCVFIIWCIFIGMCTGLIWNFLFWFIEEDLGGKNEPWIKTLEGIAMAIQCLGGELPLFFLSGWIVRKFGHVHCMTFILLAMGVRFILYSILTDPWWILPIEFSNGITFGLFYSCMASYASIIAPPGTETTMQGLVGAVFEGIGASLGSFIGGYMFNEYSGLLTYRVFGIVSLTLCLVHYCVQSLIAHTRKDFVSYRPPSDAYEYVDDEQSQELKLVR